MINKGEIFSSNRVGEAISDHSSYRVHTHGSSHTALPANPCREQYRKTDFSIKLRRGISLFCVKNIFRFVIGLNKSCFPDATSKLACPFYVKIIKKSSAY